MVANIDLEYSNLTPYIRTMKVEKESEILTHLSNGLTAKEIGAILGKSPRTIEKYLELLRAKYGAKNAAHLVGIFLRKLTINP